MLNLKEIIINTMIDLIKQVLKIMKVIWVKMNLIKIQCLFSKKLKELLNNIKIYLLKSFKNSIINNNNNNK